MPFKGKTRKSYFIATLGQKFWRNPKAFTLIELMVVCALLAVISLVSYSGLAGGVRIWKRVEASVQKVDLALAWKQFKTDLIDQAPFSEIGFNGTPQDVAFPGLVTVKDAEGALHEEIGRIRYFFEEGNARLCREEIAYATLVAQDSPACEPLISGVKELTFTYYVLEDSPGSVGAWKRSWVDAKEPLAVRMEIALEGGEDSDSSETFTAVLP